MLCTRIKTCKHQNVPAIVTSGDRPNRKGH
nr:MAG TPA: hypothetical protein [Caudoviricetes sp.]